MAIDTALYVIYALILVSLIGLSVLSFIFYKKTKNKQFLAPFVAFCLLVIQNVIIYIPLPQTKFSSDLVIISKLSLTLIAYLILLGYVYYMIKKHAKDNPKPIKKVAKKKKK